MGRDGKKNKWLNILLSLSQHYRDARIPIIEPIRTGGNREILGDETIYQLR